MLDSNKTQRQVLSIPCGELEGEPIYLVTLCNDDTTVKLTNLEPAITAIFTADCDGKHHNIVAGYGDVSLYHDNPHYFGCLLGRYAGRITGSKFELDGDII